MTDRRSHDHRIATGIFCVVCAIYVLSGPGRIDSVDGQIRYDVAVHWLNEGRPVIRDPIAGHFMGYVGADGRTYSNYGPAASVLAMPLVAAGAAVGRKQESQRFMFTLTSSVLGGLTASVLFLLYRQLNIPRRSAVFWTAACAFTTLLWPASTSTLDNAQHAFFALFSVYLGLVSAKRESRTLAALGGLVAGVLLLYQDYLLLLMPAFALSTVRSPDVPYVGAREQPSRGEFVLGKIATAVRSEVQTIAHVVKSGFAHSGQERESCIRYVCFLGAVLVNVVPWLAYNHLRFGSWFEDTRIAALSDQVRPVFGNPLAGFLTLMVSPGKSVFLYSPPLIIGILGLWNLWRRESRLATAIAFASVVLVSFLSFISFAGGDWCWGPRYLVVLLPLWAIAMPFAPHETAGWRRLTTTTLTAGLVVQLLAVSVESHRFFFERGIPNFFWLDDRWFYFTHSAFMARPGEALSLLAGVPPTARWFNPIAEPGWATYMLTGPFGEEYAQRAPQWMQQYAVFYLPRPWPLWVFWIESGLRPINVVLSIMVLACVGGWGALQVRRGLT